MTPQKTSGRSKTIVLHLRIATASHRRRIFGISKQLTPQDRWNLNIIGEEDRLAELLTSSHPGLRPDGIISGELYDPRTRELIRRSSIPFVGIGIDRELRQARKTAAAFVLNDNAGIGTAAADYLCALGAFRSFAYIPTLGGRQRWSIQRGNSFMRKLAAAGHACRLYPQPARPEDDWRDLGAFLLSLEKPTAVLAAWDGRAVEVLEAAKAVGIPVPEQMAVLGVDDDEIICEHVVPQLSSIRTDAEGMGAIATRLLKGLMRARKGGTRAKTVTCAMLGVTERGSTRPPTPAAHLVDRALAFIAAEATGGIDAEAVARHLKISRRLLDMRFRQYCSQTVTETIVARQLEEAKRLLRQTSMSVKAVFAAAGFSATTYPYRLFKMRTGLSAAAYRAGS